MSAQVDNMIGALKAGATFTNPQSARIKQMTEFGQSHLDDCNTILLTLPPTDPNYAGVTALQVSLTAFLAGPLVMFQAHTDFLSGSGNGKFPHDALASLTATIPPPPELAVLGGLGAVGALHGFSGTDSQHLLKHLSFPSALGAMSGAERAQSGGSFFTAEIAGAPACTFLSSMMGSVMGILDPVFDAILKGLADMNDILGQAYDYANQLAQFTQQIVDQITKELTNLVNSVVQGVLSNVAGLLHALSIDPCLGQLMTQVAPKLIG